MNKPEYTPYKDALTNAMTELATIPDSVFIGQQIVYAGNPMSTTLAGVPKDKMIELPVMEETQMGMSLGIAMTGKTVVTFYPRWDFIICAANQLINHIDKFELMTDTTPHIIIRLGKGSTTPLDPGYQHCGNYFEEFKSLCSMITFFDLKCWENIEPAYEFVKKTKGVYILVEYPELYYTK